MLTLGTETLSPYRRHETVFVRAGGGEVQHVPWNIPGYGDPSGLDDSAVFGAGSGLTDGEKQKLAERIRDATFTSDVQAILEIVPTIAERQEVAARAVAIGADPSRVQQALASLGQSAERAQFFKPLPAPLRIAWGIASTVSFAASIYHGYKRNDSVGWAIWWGFMGALFPIITPTIAVAQGFAKPRKNSLGRAYRRRSQGYSGAASNAPWRVRDRKTRAREYFHSRRDADQYVDDLSTSRITGERLTAYPEDRLIVERNRS